MITRLVGALEEEHLQLLLSTLESQGLDFGKCVLTERKEVEVPAWGLLVGPHMIFMLYFRWKDFPHPPNPPPPLRRLITCCNTPDDSRLICVNPYHWSMHLSPDTSSDCSYDSAYKPPMSNVSVCDRVYDPRIGSLETGGTRQDFDELRGNPWCKILYWEGRERKGSEFPVQNSSINVMGETPHGNGLSLAALFGGVNEDERIMKTRKKICQGLVLWREEEVIWIYNRSEAPVYLNSASLDGSFYHLNLYKCPPGYAMIIYYYEMARHLMGHPEYNDRALDKADVNSVRISFAKGWGKNYHRREILCCPCWIEVHVVPTLRVEQLTPPR